MTPKLIAVAAIPVVGLLLLLGGLLLVADDQVRVQYQGRDYAGGAVVATPAGAAPTGERVEGQQVWVAPNVPDRLWLQLPDGRFRLYRLDE